MKDKIMFLCTGNSCRSQMAEGFARSIIGDIYDIYSAGIESHGLNPYAVKVMAESGVDISDHKSKKIEDLGVAEFEYVITVCGHANETCPFFPAKTKLLHKGFDDPPSLAANVVSEDDKLSIYRRVRDEIKEYIESLKKNGL